MTNHSLTYVGLGSNLNNPIQQVRQALQTLTFLPNTTLLTHSSLYRSPPLGGFNQPDYINAVALLATQLSPITLLNHLQTIEQQQGRIRTQQRWAARTLDLDILLYDNIQSANPILTLPHPGLYTRAFVLYPLHECVPELILPDGQKLHDLLQRCPTEGLVKLTNSK